MSWNIPIRIGVEQRLRWLLRRHAIDVSFIDVNFDFKRIHVDDGTDTSAGKATTGRDGRDDFTGLCRFGDDHACKGCPHGTVVELYLRTAQAGLRQLDLLALHLKLRSQCRFLGLRRLQRLPRHQIAFDQILAALCIASRLRQLRLVLCLQCLRGQQLRTRLGDAGL